MKMAPCNKRLPYYYGEPWKDDFELIAHVLRGSTAHWEMLYEAYLPRVYRFAVKRLRDPAEAEDVTQEVFFTVFTALPSFDGSVSLLIFVFHITRSTVKRRLQRSTAARWWLSRTSGRNGAFYRNMAVWVMIMAILAIMQLVLRMLPEQMT